MTLFSCCTPGITPTPCSATTSSGSRPPVGNTPPARRQMGTAENVHLHPSSPLVVVIRVSSLNLLDPRPNCPSSFDPVSTNQHPRLPFRLVSSFVSRSAINTEAHRHPPDFQCFPFQDRADFQATRRPVVHCAVGINDPGFERRIWSTWSRNRRQYPFLDLRLARLHDCLAIGQQRLWHSFLHLPTATTQPASSTCLFPPSRRCFPTATFRLPTRSN